MKNKFRYFLILLTGILFLSIGAIAQPPPPPSNPSDSGNNLPVGSPGAPVGNGAGILLLLGLAYTARNYTKRETDKNSIIL